jgi:hypothetical protein
MLPLPVDTPYGNLGLTYMQIMTRTECLNKLIKNLFTGFHTFKRSIVVRGGSSNLDESFMHKFEIEQVIYWLRKTADDFISIIFIINHFKVFGEYPEQIQVASVGKFLKLTDKSLYKLDNHIKLLTIINDVSNAYKHTLLNAQLHSHIGVEEPVVFALSAFNKAGDIPKFYSHSLCLMLKEYNTFLRDVRQMLSEDYPSTWS